MWWTIHITRDVNVAGNVKNDVAENANLAGNEQVTCENVAGSRQVMWCATIVYNANVAGNVQE